MLDAGLIYDFLKKVDSDFIEPLSKNVNLSDLAIKFSTYGTLCYEECEGRIIALVAGYTENTPNNIGYISLVAALKTYRNKGVCSRLVSDFLEIAERQKLDAVHVYTHRENSAAVAMYIKNGFEEIDDCSNPALVHFLCTV